MNKKMKMENNHLTSQMNKLRSSFNITEIIPNQIFKDNFMSKEFFYQTCRTCLFVFKETVGTGYIDSIKWNTEETSLRNKLYICCQELDLRSNSKAILCVNCFETVNIIISLIHKWYKNQGQLKEYFTFDLTSVQNYNSLCKDEIKTEEIDLCDKESNLDTKHLQPKTFENKFNIIQKYNSKLKLFNIDCNYSSTLLDTKPELCDKKCTQKTLLNRHLQIQTAEQMFKYSQNVEHNGKKLFKCFQCNNSVQNDNFKDCECIHNGELFRCPHCDYNSVQMNDMIRHVLLHTNEKHYKCFLCNYTCTQKTDMNIHIYIHTGKKPVKYSQCDCSANHNNSYVNNHMYIYTQEKSHKYFNCKYDSIKKIDFENNASISAGKKPFKCTKCDYSCTQKYYLKTHMRIHTGEKPYKCSQCNYSSAQKCSLRNHIRIHTGEKPFKCFHCNYSCAQKINLKNHIFIHIGEKPYKCFHCNYSSAQKIHLKNHILLHIGEKPFKCLHCNYSSVRKDYLKKHLSIHTGEKPFRCFQCNHSSARKHDMKKHMLIHIKRKHYKCS